MDRKIIIAVIVALLLLVVLIGGIGVVQTCIPTTTVCGPDGTYVVMNGTCIPISGIEFQPYLPPVLSPQVGSLETLSSNEAIKKSTRIGWSALVNFPVDTYFCIQLNVGNDLYTFAYIGEGKAVTITHKTPCKVSAGAPGDGDIYNFNPFYQNLQYRLGSSPITNGVFTPFTTIDQYVPSTASEYVTMSSTSIGNPITPGATGYTWSAGTYVLNN